MLLPSPPCMKNTTQNMETLPLSWSSLDTKCKNTDAKKSTMKIKLQEAFMWSDYQGSEKDWIINFLPDDPLDGENSIDDSQKVAKWCRLGSSVVEDNTFEISSVIMSWGPAGVVFRATSLYVTQNNGKASNPAGNRSIVRNLRPLPTWWWWWWKCLPSVNCLSVLPLVHCCTPSLCWKGQYKEPMVNTGII